MNTTRLGSILLLITAFSLLGQKAFALSEDVEVLLLREQKSETAETLQQNYSLAQPPVRCAEDIVPASPPENCINPVSTDDKNYCKAKAEVEKMLAIKNFNEFKSIDEGQLKRNWMNFLKVQNRQAKIDAIYEAANLYKIPPQTLAGGLTQESLMAEIGIWTDTNNYSCGMGQISLVAWCQWAETLSIANQKRIGWPTAEIADYMDENQINSICSTPVVSRLIAKAFLQRIEEGMQQKHKHPFFMTGRDMSSVTYESAYPLLPAQEESGKKLQYLIGKSFVENCSDARNGILASSHTLSEIYLDSVPGGFKKVQRYKPGQKFNKSCAKPVTSTAYPLHIGWLLATAMYNSGTNAKFVVSHYLGISNQDYANPELWTEFTPQNLVESLFFGGKYIAETTSENGGVKFAFSNPSGVGSEALYRKLCVSSRHISKIAMHATLPNQPMLTSSFEGFAGCTDKLDVPDPDHPGQLKRNQALVDRMATSGVKDL